MTNNNPTDEKLITMLSETQAQITQRHAMTIRGGSVEVDAYLFESMIMEIQYRRKADNVDPVYQCEFCHHDGNGELQWHWEDVNKAFYEQYDSGRRGKRRILYTDQPAPVVPETLPCSVLLEPGLRLGKGIKTTSLLAALARRAVYESDLAALSPEEKEEMQRGIEEFKKMLGQPAPVVPDYSAFEQWWSSEYGTPLDAWDNLRCDDGYVDEGIEHQFEAWKACRAALQGKAEKTESRCSIQAAPTLDSLPENTESLTGINESVPVTYETPVGWVACSERMPEKNQSVLISVTFNSELVEPLICSARYTGDTFRRGSATVKPGIEEATHWMPLPAAPKQDNCNG